MKIWTPYCYLALSKTPPDPRNKTKSLLDAILNPIVPYAWNKNKIREIRIFIPIVFSLLCFYVYQLFNAVIQFAD